MKKVAVLGSTGSIGTQTLDILRRHPDKFRVASLVAYSNSAKLDSQVAEFKPSYYALISRDGNECLIRAAEGCDIVVVATRGICAIECVLYCLENNIDVALANKETLVCAGKLITDKLKRSKSRLIPVDSEHFAISQCLRVRASSTVSKLLLTASGGPFLNLDKAQFSAITPSQALRHPNWNMGEKITVDSATMMNKALEVVEARWLFGVDASRIQIVVHPQSIVHSMVEFADGSVIAQLANPDMRIPIQAALLNDYGQQITPSVDFSVWLTLTFDGCNFDKFPCAMLGHEIFNYPPLCATVMNAANDVCVEKFLQGKLSFDSFYNIIMSAVRHFAPQVETLELTVDNIRLFEQRSKEYSTKLIDGEIC